MTKRWVAVLILGFIVGVILGFLLQPVFIRAHKIFQEMLPGESRLFPYPSRPEPRIPQTNQVPGFARIAAVKFKCEFWLGDLFGYPGVWISRPGEAVQRLRFTDGAKCKQIVLAADAGTAVGLMAAETPRQLVRLVLVSAEKPLSEIKIEPLECQTPDGTMENLHGVSPDGTRLLLECSEQLSDNAGYAWRRLYPCRGIINGSKVELERLQP